METITTPFSAKHRVVHKIYVEPENYKSRAAYILLYDKLSALDDSPDWASELKLWLLFRKEYLQKVLLNEGKLVCSYCGREDLVEGYHSWRKKHRNMKIPNLATIDHIHPLSKGGEKYDTTNCCVSCRPCNSKKSNKILN